MNLDFLRFEKDRILVEQLRLICVNLKVIIISALTVQFLIAWALYNHRNAGMLMPWLGAAIFMELSVFIFARQTLKRNIPAEQTRKAVSFLIVLVMTYSVIWGILPLISLDDATAPESILVVSSLAGVAAHCLSAYSPIYAMFVVSIVPMMTILAVKVWMLPGAAYQFIGVAIIVYVVNLLLQGYNSFRATRSSINLQFENIGLVGLLREEKENAEEMRHKAEAANAAKSKFLAAASHDLRQPIHAQGMFLELLSRSQLNKQQISLLENARNASRASSELLTTLLDFSRIEAGVIEPQLQPFSLQTLLVKIEKELAPHARIKQLRYHTHPTKLTLHSDPALLERILRNLLTNAIRYTYQGGILVGCRQRGNQAIIEVWDTGIGIEKSQHKEIFREFHQLGNPERDRRKGLGLGLAIVQGLANTLAHKLTLDSKPGRGSVFRLTVPISTAAVAASAELAPVIESKLSGVTILVVDDEESIRIGMVRLLRDWGCDCEAAESIEEALELVKYNPPDIVISDYRLREHSTGIDAIRALRAALDESLPAMLITGDTSSERLRESRESGVPLLHKPVSPRQLYLALVDMLERTRIR